MTKQSRYSPEFRERAETKKIADDLQKSLSETKKENAELQRKVAELEAKVAASAPEDGQADAAESVEAEKESAAA